MSYSFLIKATSRDDAGRKVEAELETIVGAQPVHQTDRQAIQDVAETFINLLKEPGDDQEIVVSVWGSLGWTTEGEFTSSSVGVNASVQTKA